MLLWYIGAETGKQRDRQRGSWLLPAASCGWIAALGRSQPKRRSYYHCIRLLGWVSADPKCYAKRADILHCLTAMQRTFGCIGIMCVRVLHLQALQWSGAKSLRAGARFAKTHAQTGSLERISAESSLVSFGRADSVKLTERAHRLRSLFSERCNSLALSQRKQLLSLRFSHSKDFEVFINNKKQVLK